MRRRPCAAFSRGQRRAAMVTEPKQKAPRKPKRRRKPLRSGHSKFCLRLFRPPLAPSASCASRADPSRRGRWRRAGERREQECPLFDRIQNRPRFAGRLRKDVGRPQTGLSAATTHALAAPAKSSKNAAAKPTKPATHSHGLHRLHRMRVPLPLQNERGKPDCEDIGLRLLRVDQLIR